MAGPELLAPVPQLKKRSTWSYPPQYPIVIKNTSGSNCTRPMRLSETVQNDNFCSGFGNFLFPETETKLKHSRSNKFLRKNYEQTKLTPKIKSNNSGQNVTKPARVENPMLRISDSREGRLFTVSKVGNNGKIYLCPTNRPANENHKLSPKISPTRKSPQTTSSKFCRENPESIACAPYPIANDDSSYSSKFTDIQSHTRPHSSSNVNEVTIEVDKNAKCTNGNTFNHSSDGSNSLPTLRTRIPSYRLGSPQFSAKGSAFLVQGSRKRSDLSPHSYLSNKSQPSFLDVRKTGSRDTFRQSPVVTEIFNALNLNSTRDNPYLVHRSASGKLLAATPPCLVAEITSPALVDYDLLSDFFLTFRSFLDTKDLMYMLIARLAWSSLRSDSLGTVVSVRTFVAIRHWLLNYFIDDFLEDCELRKLFYDLLNDFLNQKDPNSPRSKVSLKVVGELKKCWRSLCTVYRKSSNNTAHLESPDPVESTEVDNFRDIHYDMNFQVDMFYHGSEKRNKSIFQYILADSKLNFERQRILTETLHVESSDMVSHLNNDIQCRAPLTPQYISSDKVSCSLTNCHKGVKSEGGSVGCSISKKSILQIGSSIKLLNKSNDKHEQSHQPKSESSNECCRCQQSSPKEKENINAYSSVIPLVDSNGRGKLLRSRRSALDSNNPPLSEELNTHADRFQCIGNPMRVTPAREPGIKKLISSVRRVFSSTTDQISSSLHFQNCLPQTVPLHSRDDNLNQCSNPATATKDTSDSNSIRNIERIDILSAMIATELEDACKKTDSRFDGRLLTEPILSPNITHNFQVKSVRSLDSFLQSDEDNLDQHSMSNKTFLENDSSTSRSFILSDFSYYPSVDTFATACMRPNFGPTPPITPTYRMPCTDRENFDSITFEKGDKTPLSEDTPSLVIDSNSSVEDERSAPSNSPIFEGPDHSSLGVSFDTESSSQLHTLCLDSTNWKNEQSSRTIAISEAVVDGRENSLNTASKSRCSKPLRRRPGGYLRSQDNFDVTSSHTHLSQISSDHQSIDSPRSLAQNINPSHAHAGSFRKDYDRNYRISSKLSVSCNGSHVGLQSLFEKEVQFLSQLPDDDEDSGTVEAALLKLEGKFDKVYPDNSASTSHWSNIKSLDEFQNFNLCNSPFAKEENDKIKNRKYVLKANVLTSPPVSEARKLRHNNLTEGESENINYSQDLPKKSEQERESSDIMIPENSISFWQSFDINNVCLNRMSHQSALNDFMGKSEVVTNISEPPKLSTDTINSNKPEQNNDKASEKSDDLKSRNLSSLDTDTDEESNFLRVMNESTPRTIYTHGHHASKIFRPFLSSEISNSKESLYDKTLYSPPIQKTSQTELDSSIDCESVNIYSNYTVANSKLENSEVSLPMSQVKELRSYRGASLSMNPLRLHRISQIPKEKTPTHLPFILVFNPETLAQQFTLVEKDVVSQIYWKDLAEMRWKDVSLSTTSWVSYLESQKPPHGVQAFFTRFNLMIKWVTSECVLTRDKSERVNCLIQFIRIADKCRKYRNFATMIQIVVALTSDDIMGLTKTWVQVPSAEIRILQELAALVLSQGRQILRAEMESSNLENGCIPFLQIYTKDLHENAKNPIKVIGSLRSELMVDFENCRKKALAIKNILRLLEASQNYRFSSIKDVFERCYWIAALNDEQILAYRKLIQD